MKWLWALLMILPSFLSTLCTSQDRITAQEPITGNRTIISAGGNFALGFFSPGNSTNTYLGIWYNNIPDQTPVWIANRDKPLPNNSPAVFMIGQDGNLVLLLNGDEVVTIWSSNIVPFTSLSANSSAGVLLDTGNFVLVRQGESNLQPLWRSLDHPTDTLLPGIKTAWNKRTGSDFVLRSWADEEDPRPGNFSVSIDTIHQIKLWKGKEPYWRTNPHPVSSTIGLGNIENRGFTYYISNVVEGDESSLMIAVSENSFPFRITVLPKGDIEVLIWDNTSGWKSIWREPMDRCDTYGLCGPFGTCERNVRQPLQYSCKCLTSFVPRDVEDWNAGNWTGGCVRRERLSCDGEQEGFLKYQRMKVPDHSVSLGNMTSLEECQLRCIKNCSCTAYSYVNITGLEDTIHCLTWYGELVDMITNDFADYRDLFVRTHGSTLAHRAKHTYKHLIALTACIAVGICFIIIAALFWRRKRSQRKEAMVSKLLYSDNGNSRVGQNDEELQSFSLRDVLAATGCFAEEEKLGEGGYGPVYKGSLSEKEVAIKRLSTKSSQGQEQFMNELKLIAKLQHKNLVRLLGCCAEEDEKILIYEYMPNGSLDKFIFDEAKNPCIDWDIRFKILEGIAQGLLYLHEYSRVKVIHRDLKASNILLDHEMTPKISDFGMARNFGLNESEANTNRLVGTFGYMSPEYALYGRFSEKSDIYSYGVLLLEIVTGKKNTEFHCRGGSTLTMLEWAWEQWVEGRSTETIDPSIRNTSNLEQAVKCIYVGLRCVQESPSERPKTSQVVAMLNSETTVVIPPRKPAFSTHKSFKNARCTPQVLEHDIYSTNDVTMTTIEPR